MKNENVRQARADGRFVLDHQYPNAFFHQSLIHGT
jgi:hypothetical protein